ncbi:MAG: hypothetical protein H8F28_27275 [Fibrella sp.]|nr:hypothetical protein [Armatimonadota bacterium]
MKLKMMLLAASTTILAFLGNAHAQMPSEAKVKSAITRLLKVPVEKPSSDMALVVDFAEKSDVVTIDIVQGLVNVGDTPRDTALLGYYVAGAVQYDLMNPKQAKDKLADKVAAVRASLLLYKAIRARDNSFKRPMLDDLAALDKKGQLSQHIRSVMGKWNRG